MLIDRRVEVVETHKVSSSFEPKPESYPHYWLQPIATETGKKYCLFFYISPASYLILANGLSRPLAIRSLKRWRQTALFDVFEVFYG